jgi:hypothetical protein
MNDSVVQVYMGLLKKSGNMGFVGVYCINPLGNRIKQGVCDTPLHQNLDHVCFSTAPYIPANKFLKYRQGCLFYKREK